MSTRLPVLAVAAVVVGVSAMAAQAGVIHFSAAEGYVNNANAATNTVPGETITMTFSSTPNNWNINHEAQYASQCHDSANNGTGYARPWNTATIDFSVAVQVSSLYYAAFLNPTTFGTEVTIKGSKAGVEVFNSGPLTHAGAYVYTQYTGGAGIDIDKLILVTTGGSNSGKISAIDTITVIPAPLPEPAAVVLMGLGGALMVGRRRR